MNPMPPVATTPILAPMTVGKMLDAGFRMWCGDFGRLFVLLVVIHLPVAVLRYLYLSDNALGVIDGLFLVRDPDTFNRTIFFLLALDVLGGFISCALATAFFARRYVGDPFPLGDVMRSMLTGFFPFLGLAIVYGRW